MDLMFGVINLNKPTGLTSRAALNRLQRLLGKTKLGHGGTLDPLANGVLLVLVGKATRLMPYVHDLPKSYLAHFRLGWKSDTEDIEGEVQQLADPPQPSISEIQSQLEHWTGSIQQRPPVYSALKVEGQRSYKRARRGEVVALATREVQVHQLKLVSYDYPEMVLRIECGGGTYVRSLGRDIAESMGTAAMMTQLTRTAVGGFYLEKSLELDGLDESQRESWLRPARLLIPHMPVVKCSDDQWQRLAQGQVIEHPGLAVEAWKEAAAVDAAGELLGIVGPAGEDQLRPLKSFRV